MHDTLDPTPPLLTLPDSPSGALSIRAKALVFRDPRSAGLLEHVERIARSEATVLVIGETGTGKELIARHLHTQSGRKGPFLAVNCGAFSESLIDAELFGHESGAFTGATGARAGWFEAANGGTLFLDEIADLPLALQVKLLRVLQERQVVRLGSRRSISLDVRLIAATNIDLRQAIEAHHFRADLFYRLSVAIVSLPPLRGRTGDILPLAQHFIDLYGTRLGLRDVTLTVEAQAALLAYPWPGNIRELENVVHFALIVCQQGQIRLADLKLAPSQLQGSLQPSHAEPALAASDNRQNDTTHDRLLEVLEALLDDAGPGIFQRVERATVQAAFTRAGENQVKAARSLGVTRNTLRTLLKRHGMLSDPSTARPDDIAALGASLPH